MNAQEFVDRIRSRQLANPPAGVDVEFLEGFWKRNGAAISEFVQEELGEYLDGHKVVETAPDLWSKKRRTDANIKAMEVFAKKKLAELKPADRVTLSSYSGWGGLDLYDAEKQMPEGIPHPTEAGMLNEYYTPTKVAREVIRIISPLIGDLPRTDGKLIALEPSAGIGRFINAMQGPKYKDVRWKAIEYQELSAMILQGMRPDVEVCHTSFEAWYQDWAPTYNQRIGLVLSNPPYGERTKEALIDKEMLKGIYKQQAYCYFLRRAMDLVADGGLGVFVVPYDFLSSRTIAYRKAREDILLRHHLSCAYRLPEKLFPGAQVTVDLLFFRSRGGTITKIAEDDKAILDGEYFEIYPQHILGQEVGRPDDPETIAKKASGKRIFYKVLGTFDQLPDLVERAYCEGCVMRHLAEEGDLTASPTGATKHQFLSRQIDVDLAGDFPQPVKDAHALGIRVDTYLSKLAQNDIRFAVGAWQELVDALEVWVSRNGNPHKYESLKEVVRQSEAIRRFLTAYDKEGNLIEAFRVQPKMTAMFDCNPDTEVEALANWMYRTSDGLTHSELMKEIKRRNGKLTSRKSEMLLRNGDWYQDGAHFENWIPKDHFLSGNLWVTYDRMMTFKEDSPHYEQAQRQAADILKTIRPKIFDQIEDIRPNQTWVPTRLIGQWIESTDHLTDRFNADFLNYREGLYQLKDWNYAELGDLEQKTLKWFIGWLNNDYNLFRPGKKDVRVPKLDDEGHPVRDVYGRQIMVTKELTTDDRRLQFVKNWTELFRAWLSADEDRKLEIEEAYNRKFFGWVNQTYSSEPLHLCRWTTTGKIPWPYQAQAARRIIANRGGLLAFDVGVGKTITACACIAHGRQNGWCKRPVIIVPASIVFKWYEDILDVLPDYRIGVIGSNRKEVKVGKKFAFAKVKGDYIASKRSIANLGALGGWSLDHRDDGSIIATSKKGLTVTFEPMKRQSKNRSHILVGAKKAIDQLLNDSIEFTSETDSPEQRAQKWSGFQAGMYDIMLLTYDAMKRTRIDMAEVKRYCERTAAIQRRISLERRNIEKKKKPTPRDIAKINVLADKFIEQMMELPQGWEWDPGISWDDLGIDFLVVDEAQNMKNLYLPEPQIGGVPQFMGSPGEGSKIAWQLDFRSHIVRQKCGRGGVLLLSATPAKNSPLEFYNLIQYVDHHAWNKVGIDNPEAFSDRYLDIQTKTTVTATMEAKAARAVAGFKNLDELRGVLFRYGEFKTAEDVGLELPDVKPELIQVDMDDRQNQIYDHVVAKIEQAIKAMKGGGVDSDAKNQILGYMAQLSMVAIHASLYRVTRQFVMDEDGEVIEAVPDNVKASMFVGGVVYQKESEPDEDGKTRMLVVKSFEHGEKLVNQRSPSVNWHNASQYDANCPKIDECIKRIKYRTDCGHIVFCDNTAVHWWMRAELERAGYDRTRIAVLNAIVAKQPADRQKIARGFTDTTNPQYDIVIANNIAYEGMDLQTRTCAIHHLDFPWEPASLQQRNGRGVRQGNEWGAKKGNVIEINYYMSKQSLDGKKYNMIEGKRGWMVALIKSQDRKTNNPGATMDLSMTDMLLLITRDPEKTKALIEEQAAALRVEQLQKERALAARTLRETRSLFRKAGFRKTTPAQAIQYRTEAESALQGLSTISTDAWPWYHLAHHARDREMYVTASGVPISENMRFCTTELGEVLHRHVGSIREMSCGVRLPGRCLFGFMSLTEFDKLDITVQDVEPDMWGNGLDYDETILEAYRTVIAQRGRYFNIRNLNLKWASEEWSDMWWPRIAGLVFEALERSYNTDVLPGLVNGVVIITTMKQLVAAGGEPFAPTMAGYQEYLRLAPMNEDLRFTAISDAAGNWWDLKTPPDLLSRHREAKEQAAEKAA